MIAKCKISLKDYKEAVEWLEKAKNCKQGNGGVSVCLLLGARSATVRF